jgi:hypothetical protein
MDLGIGCRPLFERSCRLKSNISEMVIISDFPLWTGLAFLASYHEPQFLLQSAATGCNRLQPEKHDMDNRDHRDDFAPKIVAI